MRAAPARVALLLLSPRRALFITTGKLLRPMSMTEAKNHSTPVARWSS